MDRDVLNQLLLAVRTDMLELDKQINGERSELRLACELAKNNPTELTKLRKRRMSLNNATDQLNAAYKYWKAGSLASINDHDVVVAEKNYRLAVSAYNQALTIAGYCLPTIPPAPKTDDEPPADPKPQPVPTPKSDEDKGKGDEPPASGLDELKALILKGQENCEAGLTAVRTDLSGINGKLSEHDDEIAKLKEGVLPSEHVEVLTQLSPEDLLAALTYARDKAQAGNWLESLLEEHRVRFPRRRRENPDTTEA